MTDWKKGKAIKTQVKSFGIIYDTQNNAMVNCSFFQLSTIFRIKSLFLEPI